MESMIEQKLAFRRLKQLNSLYSQAELALLASVVCGAILVLFVHSEASTERLGVWAAAMLSVALGRYILIHRFRVNAKNSNEINFWRFSFIATLVASGSAWGSASFLVAPSPAVVDQAIVVIFICGFVAGGVAAFSVDRLAFVAFAVPALGAPAAFLAIFGDPGGRALSAVLVLFGCFLLANAFRSYKAHKRDFDTQFENQQLAMKLDAEKTKIAALADDLEVRVRLRTEELSFINEQLNEQIEEKNLAENATRIQEARFHEVFNQAPISMLVVHAQSGRIVGANGAICDLLGYDVSELAGMQAEKLLCPSERKSKDSESIFNRDGVTECRLLHRRGFVMCGRTSTGRLSGGESDDAHVVVQIEDLSELKQAQDSLLEHTESFEVAFDSAPVGIAVIDGSGRIVNGNRCLRTILQLDGRLEGRSLTSILNAEAQTQNSEVLSRIFSGELDSVEFEHLLYSVEEQGRKEVVVRLTRVKSHSGMNQFAVVHIRDKVTSFEQRSNTNTNAKLTPVLVAS